MRILGKNTKYPKNYDSGLLDRVPRQLNRSGIQLDVNKLPFTGYDVWHIYEISFLLNNGAPVSAIGKLVIACESEYLVESKSLKLYFNSFNMEKLGDTVVKCFERLKAIVTKDLSGMLGASVEIDFTTSKATHKHEIDYTIIDNLAQEFNSVTEYSENPTLLQVSKTAKVCSERLFSTLLKSNCRVTGQPDWGNVFIAYKSSFQLNHTSLLKYIISYRNENHFHEEIVETIFKRLYDLLEPEELTVIAYYTRRGGIDINPCRTTDINLVSKQFLDSSTLQSGHFRQ